MESVCIPKEQFSEIVGQKITKKSITQIFPGLYKKVFPQNGQMKEYCITHEEHKYHVECRNMVFKNLEQTEGEIQEDKETQGDILQVFYFFDETQLIGYKEESRKKSLVAGLIYIDNYEEVLENMEEVRQSLLLALVERKIMKYMQGLDAIIKGFEKDKFLFVFEEEKLEQLMESKFSILDEVRLINIGNELSIILPLVDVSFGVGAGAFAGDKKNNAGGGMGGKMSPSAVLVIQNGATKLVNIKNQDTVTKILDMVPDVVDRITGKFGDVKMDDDIDEAISDVTDEE